MDGALNAGAFEYEYSSSSNRACPPRARPNCSAILVARRLGLSGFSGAVNAKCCGGGAMVRLGALNVGIGASGAGGSGADGVVGGDGVGGV